MGAWLHHWLYEDFWCLIWPNGGAVPLEAVIGGAGAWLMRDRIGRRLVAWLHKHHQAHVARQAGGDDAVR